jgi:hypothetical protein
MSNIKKKHCFAFLPTYIDSSLIWWKWYLKIYQYKDISIIQCETTSFSERCGISPGYKDWVLIDKKIINDKK